MDCDFSIFECDALQREAVLELLAQCIVQLPETPKKILAMYYHENLELSEIAIGFGLTEDEIDLIRTQTVRLLQTNLFRDLEQLDGLNEIPLNYRSERLKAMTLDLPLPH